MAHKENQITSQGAVRLWQNSPAERLYRGRHHSPVGKERAMLRPQNGTSESIITNLLMHGQHHCFVETYEYDSPGKSECHHSPGKVEGSITALTKAGAVLQLWSPTAERIVWACLLRIKRRASADSWSIVIVVKRNLGCTLGPGKWRVGFIPTFTLGLPTFTFRGGREPGKRGEGRRRWLLNLGSNRRAALHGKK